MSYLWHLRGSESLTERPMELKPNTYYRTRGGEKAFVAGIRQRTPYRCVGWIGPSEGLTAWTTDGLSVWGCANSGDLIAEWDEPTAQAAHQAAWRSLRPRTDRGGLEKLLGRSGRNAQVHGT